MSLAGYFINITSASRLSIRLSLSLSLPPAHSLCHPFISRLAILSLSLSPCPPLPPPSSPQLLIALSISLAEDQYQRRGCSSSLPTLPLFFSLSSSSSQKKCGSPLASSAVNYLHCGVAELPVGSGFPSSNFTCCFFFLYLHLISKCDDSQIYDFTSSAREGKQIKLAEYTVFLAPKVL